MKKPMLNTILNGILVGASGYAMYAITPSCPYAFTACAFACCHGLLGLIQSLAIDPQAPTCSKIKDISTGVMELLPLPLVNIELYLKTGHEPSIALAHGLFVVPLIYDMIAKLFTENGSDSSTETLKELMLVGDVVSLTLLGVDQDNFMYLILAMTAFCSKYGGPLLEYFNLGSGKNSHMFFDSLFCVLTGMVLQEGAA